MSTDAAWGRADQAAVYLGDLDAAGILLLNFTAHATFGTDDEAVVLLGDGHLNGSLRYHVV